MGLIVSQFSLLSYWHCYRLLSILAFCIVLLISFWTLNTYTWRDIFFFSLLPTQHMAFRISVPLTRGWATATAAEALNPNHWTTKELPEGIYLLSKGTQQLPTGGKLVFQLPPGHFRGVSWPTRGSWMSIQEDLVWRFEAVFIYVKCTNIHYLHQGREDYGNPQSHLPTP